ncbi:hypothetical protein PENANT_c048G11375 [Penicillium antarcticum]|uniref:COP9 signalosome complex subunit 3 N-terminal helical repeats domain-containing protein n=1 Tax=Penicillium antarcticum TaxID=416450 RepID=A0A1V6PRD9_9EURO|nr:hypothetical protein PENANT_c048G11375 [Penicillium antarcticum]
MTLVSDLAAASAHVHDSAKLPSGDYDRQLRELVEYLKRLLSTKALDALANDESILDHFNPARDSIPYLFILRLQIQTAQETTVETVPTKIQPKGVLWTRSVDFLRNFDRIQVRYVGREWRELLEIVGHASQAVSQSDFVSMQKLIPVHCQYWTTTFAIFQLCLCIPLQSFLCFVQRTSPAGMVYMALKDWRKALHFLGVVVSTPVASSVSLVMVEAYKKWVLVGLLEHGRLYPPPTITTPHVMKIYQSMARPYVILAHAFERGDIRRLRAEVDSAKDIWENDNNTGLVSQVVNSFYRQAIIKLGKTFAALTVADLAKQVFPLPVHEEIAESVIVSLVLSGALDATLLQTQDQAVSSMLRFSTTSSFTRLSHEMHIQSQLQKERFIMEALVGNLRESNQTLGLSDECVDSVHKGQAWSGSEVNPILGEEVGLEMDEDLMGDMP